MIRVLLPFFILVLLSACSFKSKPDAWKYKSINAFSSYTNNFLSDRDALAKGDLKRAIHHAKQSANLNQLSRIYLGKCALNISVGIEDKCLEYQDIESLLEDKELDSYYKLISTSLKPQDIKTLDSTYKNFAQSVLASNYTQAKKELFDMDVITSKLLSASLIKERLNFAEVERLIDDASFYGYKKSVLFWLNVLQEKTTSEDKLREIDKKLRVLGSLTGV